MTDITHPAATAPAIDTGLDIKEIMRLLPHRYPFLLIDRVLELRRKERIVAVKNVTINEPFFAGHFPGSPVMPGVLMVEAMVQAGGLLLLREVADRNRELVFLTGIERAKFRRPVVPGDQLRIEVEAINWQDNSARMEGIAYVGDKRATEATIVCELTVPARASEGHGGAGSKSG